MEAGGEWLLGLTQEPGESLDHRTGVSPGSDTGARVGLGGGGCGDADQPGLDSGGEKRLCYLWASQAGDSPITRLMARQRLPCAVTEGERDPGDPFPFLSSWNLWPTSAPHSKLLQLGMGEGGSAET